MIERPDADALMAGPLGQWLGEQDALRAEARAKAAKWRKIGILGAIGVAVLVLAVSGGHLGAAVQFGFFTGLAGFGMAEWVKRPVIAKIKGGINSAIAEALDLSYSATVIPGKQFETARAFEMLPSFDNSRFEDMWSGLLGMRPFVLHECRLTEQRGSGKNRRTVTVFAGSLMQIGFARSFTGTTLIERERKHRGFFGGEKESIELAGLRLDRAPMVDPRFEGQFNVWTTDQTEARYLVHPEYVERIQAVEQAFSGQKIRALFQGGDLLLVLETGNLFESGSLHASDDRALLERSIVQFSTLAELAARLNERPRAGFN